MKKIGIIIGLSISVFLTGCFNHSSKEASSNLAAQNIVDSPDIIEVEGRVVAKNKRDIHVDFPAVVEELYIQKGVLVERGKPLVALDLSDYKSAMDI